MKYMSFLLDNAYHKSWNMMGHTRQNVPNGEDNYSRKAGRLLGAGTQSKPHCLELVDIIPEKTKSKEQITEQIQSKSLSKLMTD